MLNLKQYNIKKLNISLIFVVLILTVISLFVLRIVDNSLFKNQILGVILGMAVCFAVSIFDYHTICGFAAYLYGFGLILLILVHVPGIGVKYNDAYRWIKIGPGQIQPSEMCKVILIIVIAQFFTLFRESLNNWKAICVSFIIMIIPIALIFTQPDLSSSLVLLFYFLIMLYSAGISYKIIVPFLAISLPVGIVGVWYVCQPYQNILEDYQQGRILGLFNPENYPNIMYQQNKSVGMLGNGKLYGIFNGGSTDELTCIKLPIVESDFIFTAVGETLGFIGACIVILLLLVLVFKCLSTAKRAKDYTGKLICIGVSAMFMFQVFANIGVVTRILPNTGLPLPFISYGSSALLSYFVAIGLVINIGLQGKTTLRG